jgi:hypothetical protein
MDKPFAFVESCSTQKRQMQTRLLVLSQRKRLRLHARREEMKKATADERPWLPLEKVAMNDQDLYAPVTLVELTQKRKM